eukprot:TRINITY_DN188_c1_g1_i2.p1 TRINITY_DN188_c1_g1~~TRINITY_DN188_c1_g1_i2.p1  ORF type:complete len:128 (-),score=15.76 TRINITY_DN188_c1_g1_i2:40-423(-)
MEQIPLLIAFSLFSLSVVVGDHARECYHEDNDLPGVIDGAKLDFCPHPQSEGEDCFYNPPILVHSFNEARRLCQEHGGDLAVPTDEQHKLIQQLLSKESRRSYIGGYRVKPYSNMMKLVNGAFFEHI